MIIEQCLFSDYSRDAQTTCILSWTTAANCMFIVNKYTVLSKEEGH